MTKISGVCCSFQDERDPRGRGIVKDPWGNIYNHTANDTDDDLRAKFTGLFFGQALGGVFFRLPYKIYDLITGGFVSRASLDAHHEFRILQVEKSKTGQKVHRIMLTLLMAKHLFINLIKDIAKIATYPLATVGMQFASILGLICPLEGRVVFGKIEDIWSPDLRTYTHSYTNCLDLMLFYAAPCMQTKQTWNRKNLYKAANQSYQQNAARSIRLKFATDLRQHAVYFNDQFDSLKDSVKTLKTFIKQVKTISAAKWNEFRAELINCRTLFDDVIKSKNNWIDNDLQGEDQSLPKITELVGRLKVLAQFQV